MKQTNHCLLKHGATINHQQLKETVAAFEQRGQTKQQAYISAVEDKLDELKMERTKVIKAVRAAYVADGGKAFEPTKAEQPALVAQAEVSPEPAAGDAVAVKGEAAVAKTAEPGVLTVPALYGQKAVANEETAVAPKGEQVSFYAGKFGKGMGKDAAKLEAMRLNRTNADKNVTYSAEEHNDDKLENPWAVVGRKAAQGQPTAAASPVAGTVVASDALAPANGNLTSTSAEQREAFSAAEKRRKVAGTRARQRANEANPFKAFIAKNGILLKLANEFAPGLKERRSAMVQGYGPIFKNSGLQLDMLAERAVEDGFLLTPDVAQLSSMIHDVLMGKRHIAQYAEGVAEDEMSIRIMRQREMEAESEVSQLSDEALYALDENTIIPWTEYTDDISAFLREAEATEQEIQDAIAQESERQTASDQGAGDVAQTPARERQGDRQSGNEEARPQAQDLLGDVPNASQQAAADILAAREKKQKDALSNAPAFEGLDMVDSRNGNVVAPGQQETGAEPVAPEPEQSSAVKPKEEAKTERTRFSTLAVGDVFHTGKAKGSGANSETISWIEWEKISDKQAKAVAVHGAFKNRWLNTIENFQSQSTVFKESAPTEPTAAKRGDAFIIDLGAMFGKVPYRASEPVQVSDGYKVLSSEIIVRTVKVTKQDAKDYGLPDTIHAWRVSAIKNEQGDIYSQVEAMTEDHGRTPQGEVVGYFTKLSGHASDAVNRIAPPIQKAALKAYEAAKAANEPGMFGAPADHKVGDLVKLTKPNPAGGKPINIAGHVTKIMPDGKLEVKTQQDGYQIIAPSELGHTEIAQPAGKIEASATENAGEELKANRRGKRTTGLQWNDISDKDAALRVSETVKPEVYPKPDYQAIADASPHPLVSYIVKLAYDAIAPKPNTRAAPTDAQLKMYIEGVNRYMAGVLSWAGNEAQTKQWLRKQGERAGAYLGMTDSPEKTLLDAVYPDGWQTHREEVILIGGNKALGALQPGLEDARKGLKEIDKGWPSKQEAWQKQGYRIVSGDNLQPRFHEGNRNNKDAYVYAEIALKESSRAITIVQKTFDGATLEGNPEVKAWALEQIENFKGQHLVLDKRNRLVGQDETQEAATEKARELTKRESGPDRIDEKGIGVEQASRSGVERRMPGEGITSDRLKETFGFKGVNFGNWMLGDSNAKERQLHLNHAYDAFMDLADILGIPPKAISMNGMMGFAVGAQGSGGRAAAHFVPGVNEINLTREAGAGALAHEWGHALDHYFARLAGLDRQTEPFLTEHAGFSAMADRMVKDENGNWVHTKENRFGSELRPEILAHFKAIVNAMEKRPMTNIEVAAQKTSYLSVSKASLDRWLAAVRTTINQLRPKVVTDVNNAVALAKFDKLAERIKAMDLGDGKIAASSATYISPVVDEIRSLYKQAAGRQFPIDQIKGLQSAIDSVKYASESKDDAKSHEPQMTSTKYASEAYKLDKDEDRKPAYWRTKLEMFARAFDAYVSDKLAEQAANNTYLHGLNKSERTVPVGQERKDINAQFDALMNDIQTKETPTGTAMFSQGSVTTPTTVPALQQAIKEFTGTFLKNQLGRIVATTSDKIKSDWIPQLGKKVNLQSEGEAGKAQAFYDPSTKTVFLIADHIEAGTEQAVLAHELMHKHGQAVLGEAGWNRLHGVISGWKQAEVGSQERAVYDYAAGRVEAAGVDLSTQELFPYAVEAAIKMGIKPNAVARQGTVARWLASVRQNLMMVWNTIVNKPDTFKAQDLVNLAFGIAQRENNPELGAINEPMTNNNVVGNQGGRSADDTTPLFSLYTSSPNDSLGSAKAADKRGESALETWKKHGWLVFDGQWRRAIATDAMKIKEKLTEKPQKLFDVVDFPKLEKLYPDVLSPITVRIGKSPYGDDAWYDEKAHEIVIAKHIAESKYKGKLIHEIQHVVQLADLREGGSAPRSDRTDHYMEYFAKPGEVEARDAEGTADLTQQQLKDHTPLLLDEAMVQGIAMARDASNKDSQGQSGARALTVATQKNNPLAVVKNVKVLPEISEAHDEEFSSSVTKNSKEIIDYLNGLGIKAVEIKPVESSKIVPEFKPKDARDYGKEYGGGTTFNDWSMRRLTGALKANDPKAIKATTVGISLKLEKGTNAVMVESALKHAGFDAHANNFDSVTITLGYRPGMPSWNLEGKPKPLTEFISNQTELEKKRISFNEGKVLSNEPTAPESGGAQFSRSATINKVVSERKTVIVGQTNREYTLEQLDAMKHVGFQVEMPSIKDRVQAVWKDAGKKLAQGLVDQFAPIKDIDKQAYGLLRLSKGASGAFEVFLNGGKLRLTDSVYDFDEDQRGGVVDRLLKPLQGEHHDFFRWIAANRAERLAGAQKENLFTPEDIAALKTLADGELTFNYTMQNGPLKGKTTRSRALAYRDSNVTFNGFQKNILDMAEQSGLIDGEARQLWEHEFYVPFYRVEEDGSIAGAHIKNGAVRQQAFKSLTGRLNKLNADLMDNTLMNWAHLLDASAKNRAARATIEAIEKMGAAIPLDGNAGKGSVWFRENGQKRWSLIDDPQLMTAVSALEYTGMRSPVMNAMSTFKHVLTIGVTASPFFKVRNLIRDSVSVIGTGNISYNPVKNLGEGWKLTAPKSDAYFRLMAGGGTIHFGTMMEGSESKRVQALVESGVDASTILNDEHKVKAFYRKFIEPSITAYNELGNRGEAINRASLYDQLVKQGMSHADASLQARDLMDFSMGGSFTAVRFLTQVVPFFNARIQGLYKLGRAAKEDPARFSAVLGATAAFSLLLLAAYSDDDDWNKREDWDRNNFWWFKFGGMAFRIPKPFEIGAIATLAERGFELAFDKEMTGKRFRKQVVNLLGDNLSMNPIPQMVKPILDVYANTNSYSGRPIETMGMERLQSEYRFTDRTSMAARGASTAINAATELVGVEGLSPVQIDHMLRGYFGWLGSFVVGAGDVLARPLTNQPGHAAPDYWKTATGSMVTDYGTRTYGTRQAGM